jgi:rubrerythrin
MVIDNRNLAEGAVLSVTYKKAEHRCTVIKTDKGLGFQLANGSVFASPSSAGKAITGRVSCDGWKFWSLAKDGASPEFAPSGEPEVEPTTTEAPAAKVAPPKVIRQIKKMPNQKSVPEGSTKFWCSACMKGFVIEGSATPESCPEGHPKDTTDEFAALSKAEVQEDGD